MAKTQADLDSEIQALKAAVADEGQKVTDAVGTIERSFQDFQAKISSLTAAIAAGQTPPAVDFTAEINDIDGAIASLKASGDTLVKVKGEATAADPGESR